MLGGLLKRILSRSPKAEPEAEGQAAEPPIELARKVLRERDNETLSKRREAARVRGEELLPDEGGDAFEPKVGAVAPDLHGVGASPDEDEPETSNRHRAPDDAWGAQRVAKARTVYQYYERWVKERGKPGELAAAREAAGLAHLFDADNRLAPCIEDLHGAAVLADIEAGIRSLAKEHSAPGGSDPAVVRSEFDSIFDSRKALAAARPAEDVSPINELALPQEAQWSAPVPAPADPFEDHQGAGGVPADPYAIQMDGLHSSAQGVAGQSRFEAGGEAPLEHEFKARFDDLVQFYAAWNRNAGEAELAEIAGYEPGGFDVSAYVVREAYTIVTAMLAAGVSFEDFRYGFQDEDEAHVLDLAYTLYGDVQRLIAVNAQKLLDGDSSVFEPPEPGHGSPAVQADEPAVPAVSDQARADEIKALKEQIEKLKTAHAEEKEAAERDLATWKSDYQTLQTAKEELEKTLAVQAVAAQKDDLGAADLESLWPTKEADAAAGDGSPADDSRKPAVGDGLAADMARGGQADPGLVDDHGGGENQQVSVKAQEPVAAPAVMDVDTIRRMFGRSAQVFVEPVPTDLERFNPHDMPLVKGMVHRAAATLAEHFVGDDGNGLVFGDKSLELLRKFHEAPFASLAVLNVRDARPSHKGLPVLLGSILPIVYDQPLELRRGRRNEPPYMLAAPGGDVRGQSLGLADLLQLTARLDVVSRELLQVDPDIQDRYPDRKIALRLYLVPVTADGQPTPALSLANEQYPLLAAALNEGKLLAQADPRVSSVEWLVTEGDPLAGKSSDTPRRQPLWLRDLLKTVELFGGLDED